MKRHTILILAILVVLLMVQPSGALYQSAVSLPSVQLKTAAPSPVPTATPTPRPTATPAPTPSPVPPQKPVMIDFQPKTDTSEGKDYQVVIQNSSGKQITEWYLYFNVTNSAINNASINSSNIWATKNHGEFDFYVQPASQRTITDSISFVIVFSTKGNNDLSANPFTKMVFEATYADGTTATYQWNAGNNDLGLGFQP